MLRTSSWHISLSPISFPGINFFPLDGGPCLWKAFCSEVSLMETGCPNTAQNARFYTMVSTPWSILPLTSPKSSKLKYKCTWTVLQDRPYVRPYQAPVHLKGQIMPSMFSCHKGMKPVKINKKEIRKPANMLEKRQNTTLVWKFQNAVNAQYTKIA